MEQMKHLSPRRRCLLMEPARYSTPWVNGRGIPLRCSHSIHRVIRARLLIPPRSAVAGSTANTLACNTEIDTTITPCISPSTFTLNLSMFNTSTNAEAMTSYLLDALVDGGTPELHAIVKAYLTTNMSSSNTRRYINGAVWLILTSPEYEVN